MENDYYPLCWPGILGGRRTLGWALSHQSWTRRRTGAMWCSWSGTSGPVYQSSGLIKAKDNLITYSIHWLKRSPFMTLDTTPAEYIYHRIKRWLGGSEEREMDWMKKELTRKEETEKRRGSTCRKVESWCNLSQLIHVMQHVNVLLS